MSTFFSNNNFVFVFNMDLKYSPPNKVLKYFTGFRQRLIITIITINLYGTTEN